MAQSLAEDSLNPPFTGRNKVDLPPLAILKNMQMFVSQITWWMPHVYDPLRYTPRMDPGAPRTGGKLGKQLTFPGGDPLGSLGSE